MNIDKMLPGREMDALIAELMGWSDVSLDNGGRGIAPGDEVEGMRIFKTQYLPNWSIDISAAWQVWDRLPRRKGKLLLEVSLSDCPAWHSNGRVYVASATHHGTTQYSGMADTPELAICRAALDAAKKGIA